MLNKDFECSVFRARGGNWGFELLVFVIHHLHGSSNQSWYLSLTVLLQLVNTFLPDFFILLQWFIGAIKSIRLLLTCWFPTCQFFFLPDPTCLHFADYRLQSIDLVITTCCNIIRGLCFVYDSLFSFFTIFNKKYEGFFICLSVPLPPKKNNKQTKKKRLGFENK